MNVASRLMKVGSLPILSKTTSSEDMAASRDCLFPFVLLLSQLTAHVLKSLAMAAGKRSLASLTNLSRKSSNSPVVQLGVAGSARTGLVRPHSVGG